MALDGALNKIKDIFKGKTVAESGIEQAGKAIDQATEGKYSSQINKVEEFAKEALKKVQDHTHEDQTPSPTEEHSGE